MSVVLALLNDAFRDTNNDDDVSESGFDSMMNFQQFEKLESEKCSVRPDKTDTVALRRDSSIKFLLSVHEVNANGKNRPTLRCTEFIDQINGNRSDDMDAAVSVSNESPHVE